MYMRSPAIRSVDGVSSASVVFAGLGVVVVARLHVANAAATSAARVIASVISGFRQTSPRLALNLALALVLCSTRDIGHSAGARRGAALEFVALSMSFGARDMSRNALASGIRVVFAWK